MEIQITPDQKKTLQAYKTEAYAPLADVDTAKEALKEIVESAAEATGVDKKIISKFFTLSYKDKVKASSEEMEVISFLSE